VDDATSRRRSATLHELAVQAQAAYTERWLGRSLPVLWEQVAGATEEGFLNVGYTPNYLRVALTHPSALSHTVRWVRLDGQDTQSGQVRGTLVG
jgi:tRNA A37 methylthiotransferase MiaB